MRLLHAITHKLFGSPGKALQSPERLERFKTLLTDNTKWASLWLRYIDKPQRVYCEFLQKLPHNNTEAPLASVLTLSPSILRLFMQTC